jgi:hypothetical protein
MPSQAAASHVADWHQLTAGIEPEDAIPQSDVAIALTKSAADASALCLHGHVTSCHPQAAIDAVLERVIELWPSLSAQKRQAIFAICLDAALFDE